MSLAICRRGRVSFRLRPRLLLVSALVVSSLVSVTACGAVPVGSSPGASSSSVSATSYPLTITDDTGRKVTIPHRPTRIVSLTLGTDEILLQMVNPQRVVGVTQYASQPAMSFVADKVGQAAQLASANAEQVIALKPDLVFAADYTKPGVVQQLEQANIPVVEFTTFSSMSDVEKHVQVVANLVGDPAKGQQMVAAMRTELARVAKEVKGLSKPTVVYYSGYGYVAGQGTTVDALIADAGGINAAAGIQGWKQVGPEELVALKPDIILTDTNGPKDIVQGAQAQKLLTLPALAGVPAVEHRQVWGLSSRAITDVSQYMAWDVQDVASLLHPHHVTAYQP